MRKNESGNNSIQSDRLSRCIFGVLLIGCCGISSAATEFHPRADVGVTWTDNINLVPDDDPRKESSYGISIDPGFTWDWRAERIHAQADYTMQNWIFPDDSDRNATFHIGTASFQSELAKQWLYLDGRGSYSQQLIDPKLPSNNSNFFAINSQADALTADISPILRHDFQSVHFEARYTRGLIDYKSPTNSIALQDAKTEQRNVILSNVEDEDLSVTWNGTYNSQIARYDLSPEFSYDQAYGELGFLLGKRVRLIGRYGKESDPIVDPSEGGLKRSSWEAGLQFKPSMRTVLEGYYGERFYGPSFRGRISHEAKRVHIEVHYNEGPTTQAQELADRAEVLNPQDLASIVPTAQYFSRLTPEVFLRKSLDGNVHIKGQRTDIDLTFIDYRRQSLETHTDAEHFRGGSVGFSRALSQRSHFTIGGSANSSELRDGGSYREVDIKTGFDRSLSQHVTLSFNLFRLRRTGSPSYIANGASLSLLSQY